MSKVASISLPQLVLWYDASRIQTWPSLLARVPTDMMMRSATDVGKSYGTERMTDERHAAAEKITRNLPGLEQVRDRLILRGVGLLERGPGGYRLSRRAVALAEAYRTDPGGVQWVKQLAGLLLGREPRTRVLVRLLSHQGAYLEFAAASWFGGRLRGAVLHIPGEEPIRPFDDGHADSRTLRQVVSDLGWWALGEWRCDPLVHEFDDCRFTGQLSNEFSMHDIGLALHASCEVLLQLGILTAEAGSCWLDPNVAADVCGTAFAEDFGWEHGFEEVEPLIRVLDGLVRTMRSDTGFVVASELRAALQGHGIRNPDKELSQLEAQGRIVIEAEDYGQSRHGEGLYSDPRKQLVKIRVIPGANTK